MPHDPLASRLAPDPWCLRETRFDTATNFLHETLFALGNGYIGLRGALEEGYNGPAGTSLDGTYLNGFYESESIVYPEAAFGLAKTNQFMLNVPNAKGVAIWLGEERFDLTEGSCAAYERRIDFRTGVLVRRLEWTAPSGKRIAFASRRLVSFAHKHLFALEVELTPLNFSGPVALMAGIDGAVKNQEAGDDPRVGSAVSGPALHLVGVEQDAVFCSLVHRTHNSGFTLVSAVATSVAGAEVRAAIPYRAGEAAGTRFELDAREGQAIRLTKYGVYYSSRDYEAGQLPALARAALAQAQQGGFEALCAGQGSYLADFWAQADVEIAGDDALQQGMRCLLYTSPSPRD